MRGWWTDARAGGAAAMAGMLAVAGLGSAYTLDVNSTASLKTVSKSMAADMMSFYTGNQPGGTPGLLPSPYYWWEAGAMFGALIDYWYYTGDATYNNITEEAMLAQVGPNDDYMPLTQTTSEGNDDQGFWGMAAMAAAEYKFQNPASDKPQWVALAQAVFNTMAARWETADCGGGLRWQIFKWNNGFNYKNSISQGCFFNIGARLARYTGNQSYADTADMIWDWMVDAKFMDNQTYIVYDGANIANCSALTPYQWTYNVGVFLLGAAAMYNYTEGTPAQAKWKTRVDGLLNGTEVFFTGPNNNIMTEVACEPVNLCDLDQQSFKAYLSRWMAATTKWAPWTYNRVKPYLEASAVAAAAQCTGGDNGRMCGLKWTDDGKWDGTTGVGQQMAAMEVVLANLITEVSGPVTNKTGGTSQGDPGAGGADIGVSDPETYIHPYVPVSAGDRAGAVILTLVVLVALVASIVFMFLDENDGKTSKEYLADMRALAAGGPSAVLHKIRNGGSGSAAAAAKGKAIERTSSEMSGNSTPRNEKNLAAVQTHDHQPGVLQGETHEYDDIHFRGGGGGGGDGGGAWPLTAPKEGFYAPAPLPPIEHIPAPPEMVARSGSRHERHRSVISLQRASGYWRNSDLNETGAGTGTGEDGYLQRHSRQQSMNGERRRRSSVPSNGGSEGRRSSVLQKRAPGFDRDLGEERQYAP